LARPFGASSWEFMATNLWKLPRIVDSDTAMIRVPADEHAAATDAAAVERKDLLVVVTVFLPLRLGPCVRLRRSRNQYTEGRTHRRERPALRPAVALTLAPPAVRRAART